MKSSDEIFQLIKSMSEREKRFFRKKYLTFIPDEDKNYIKLFDEISKQVTSGNVYEEKNIKRADYSGKFIKNLSFNKNYLYRTILNTLAIFHKDSKDNYSVRNLLTQAEILSGKMLYSQSLKLLQRAKKISFEKDLFNSYYETINIERTIGKYNSTIEEYNINSENLFSEQYNTLKLQSTLLDYYTLNEKVGMFLRNFGSGRVRDKSEMEEFEKIFDNPLLKNVDNAKTFFCRYIFYNLNLQYHLTNYNFEEAYNCAKSAVELWENNPDKIAGKLDNYIFSLNNFLNTQSRTNKFKECEIYMEKMRNLDKKFPDMLTESNKVFIFYSLSIHLLSVYMQTTEPGKLRSAEEEIRNGLKLYEEKITVYQRIILYYFLSISNIVLEDYEKCIYWNSKIFNIGKTDLSEDYQCYARIIQLISFYETGYTDSLEYALKSAYHFISKRKRVYKYENIIQKYLRRSFRIKTDAELMEMFLEMKSELEEIYHDEFEKNAFDAFDLMPWLESRIRKVPTIQVLRERA